MIYSTLDKEEYIFKAIEFSKDIDSLVLLRENLRRQVMQSSLFNRVRFVKHLSDALRGMWRVYNSQLLSFLTKGSCYFCSNLVNRIS